MRNVLLNLFVFNVICGIYNILYVFKYEWKFPNMAECAIAMGKYDLKCEIYTTECNIFLNSNLMLLIEYNLPYLQVNCLRLQDADIEHIKILGDGKVFVKILKIS